MFNTAMCRVLCLQVLFNGAPLPVRSLSGDSVEEAVLQELMKALHHFTKAVYKQELSDGDDLAEWIVSQPNVMPRSDAACTGRSDGRVLGLDRDVGNLQTKEAGEVRLQ